MLFNPIKNWSSLNRLGLYTFQLHLVMSVFKLNVKLITRVKLMLSIKDVDLWWLEVGFLDAIYIMVRFPLHHYDLVSLLEPLISSKDEEENLVAGEKNPLSQLRCSRDHATFGIPFVMESCMPKTLLPIDLDKEAIACMRSYLE